MTGRPFPITLDWFRYFLIAGSPVGLDDPDARTGTCSCGTSPWSSRNEVFGTDNPDLSAFRDRGGKLIHGTAGPTR